MRELTVDGIDGTIGIYRDEWGIPHVDASTTSDAFFGQGFVQAQDRLGQLEYDRRRAYGRWAEIVGSAALEFDVFVRRCGLAAAARREHDALDATSQAVLASFAAGVNAYLALAEAPPPDVAIMGVTPERWSAWDCCAVFLVRHVVFANWQKKLWRGRLALAVGAEAVARIEGLEARDVPLIVPPGELWRGRTADPATLDPVSEATATLAEMASGSNAWALGGARTVSGMPLLAGDPHRLVEVPGVYYQCRLACPDFDAAGLAFVGVPGFPHFGQTDHVAWCVTNANGDYQDLYVERFNPDGVHYDAPGARAEAAHRTETLGVRDAAAVTIDCYETRHGPVVFGDPRSGHAVAMRSTALAEPSSGLSVLLPMLRARTVDELDGVMRAWVDPVNNFVSGDRKGTISYRTIGRIPVRAAATAWGPVPGWVDDHDWRGTVPYDEMPRLVKPDGALIVTANQRIVGDDYPHYLGLDYARPDRAVRVLARASELHEATADDMTAIHRDRRSLAADVWVDRLVALDASDDTERAALDALRAWDRLMDADSSAAAIYVTVRDAAGRIVAHDPRLASLRSPIADEPRTTFAPLELRLWPLLTALLAADDTLLLGTRTWNEVLEAALSDGVGVLRTALGDDVGAWRWGALHVCAPVHPLALLGKEAADRLNPPPVEVGGEWDTVFSTAHAVGFGYRVTTASVARYAFDLADRSQSGWVVPLGSSGDPSSAHFSDQQRAWADGTLVPIMPLQELKSEPPAVQLSPSP